jgi:GNAT superfamily N-acetyltransferase
MTDDPLDWGTPNVVETGGMADTTVRVLNEAEWSLYRDVRLRALAESPESFTANVEDEAQQDEQFWRDRMRRSHRLLAEQGQVPVGIVSVGPYEEDPTGEEVFGLYVVPEARGTGVSWRLVEAAAALATHNGCEHLYYWVGTDNGRAVGFAKNFGFSTTGYRRPARPSDLELGDQEVAMEMWLGPDGTSVPNPTSGRAATREGPVA